MFFKTPSILYVYPTGSDYSQIERHIAFKKDKKERKINILEPSPISA